MLPLSKRKALQRIIDAAQNRRMEKIMETAVRWRVTVYANKSDIETRSGYVRDVRTASPLAAFGEALHYFATDTGLPRDSIFRWEAEVISDEVK